MEPARPDIFISATSKDLGEARRVVTEALLDLNCHPVVQEHFGAGEGIIAAKEAKTIEECDAVIHLAGLLYGAAPQTREADANSRSYTQLEYDTAVRLGKPLYLFLATKTFYETAANLPSAGQPQESMEFQALQEKHRKEIRSSDRLWFEFSSLPELRDKVLQLREKDKRWAKLVRKERRHYLAISAAILVLLAIVLAGVYFLRRDVALQTQSTHEQTVAMKLQSEDLQRVREDLREIKQRLDPQSNQNGLSEEERYKQALKLVAERNKVPRETVLAQLQQFVDHVNKDPNPSPEDRDLQSVAQKFILRAFSPAEFSAYTKSLSFAKWRPDFFVLHNTFTPNLAQWRKGSPEAHLRNLERYYVEKRGWTGGPHLFVDDKHIWVFNDLTQPGIHAQHWNSTSLGIEMVGNFDEEELDDAVLNNTVKAIAILCRTLKISPDTLRLHRDDPEGQQKDCPGRKVQKADIIERVTKELQTVK